MKPRTAVSIFFLLLLTGCATLSEDECRRGNWYDIGFSDGLRGYTADYYRNHQDACSQYRISPDINTYRKGYAEGIKQYCIPSNGYQVGREGKSYYGVCKGPDAEKFLFLYHQGKREYDVEQRIQAIDNEMNEIDDKLINAKLSREEKESLITQRRSLERERTQLIVEQSSFRGPDKDPRLRLQW